MTKHNKNKAEASGKYVAEVVAKAGSYNKKKQDVNKIQQEVRREVNKNKQLKDESYALKRELRAYKGALQNMNNQVSSSLSSSACDQQTSDHFVSFGHNAYLNSLLVPRDGAASIPDDVTRMHIVRSETITANVTFQPPANNPNASATGTFILYPNHPTSLVGYAFGNGLNPEDQTPLVNSFLQKLVVAQELKESYDYGRRVSSEICIKSTTLPTGTVPLNGTMNVVRVEGTVSEIGLSTDPGENYSQILSSTANLLDKLGQIQCVDGVTILGLPDSYVSPYVRMSDATPYTTQIGGVDNTNFLVDDSQNLTLKLGGYFNPTGAALGTAGLAIFETTFNLDATIGVDIDFNAVVPLTLADPNVVLFNAQFGYEFFDPFGNQIAAVERNVVHSGGQGFNAPTDQGVQNNYVFHSNFTLMLDEITYLYGTNLSYGPVAYVRVTLSLMDSTATGSSVISGQCQYAISAKSILGTRPGVLSPVVVVSVQNLAANSVMSVSGVANYELVPNPDLRKNLVTKYGHSSEEELDYAKKILTHRETNGIRSIYTMAMYNNLIPEFRKMCNPNTADQHSFAVGSSALTWKNIANFGKKLIRPLGNVAKVLVPESEPLVSLINRGLGSSAASGVPYSSAASGGPIYFKNQAAVINGEAGWFPLENCLTFNEFWKFVEALVDPIIEFQVSAIVRPVRTKKVREFNPSISKVLLKKAAHLARPTSKIFAGKSFLFPTISTLTTADGLEVLGEGLFAIVEGYQTDLLLEAFGDNLTFTKTAGNGRIFGWKNDFGYVFPQTFEKDVSLLPVDPNILVPTFYVNKKVKWPLVCDHSCDGALWAFNNLSYKEFPMAITGQVNFSVGVPFLMPNPAIEMKLRNLHNHGRMLIANSDKADYFVDNLHNLKQLDMGKIDAAAVKFRQLKIDKFVKI